MCKHNYLNCTLTITNKGITNYNEKETKLKSRDTVL